MTIEEQIKNARYIVLLGKNGSGKSTKLRELDSTDALNTKYISPERGGSLKYNPGVDNNIATNANWLVQTRRKNRFEQFREQSAAQFRTLEMLVLREIEQIREKREDFGYTFEDILSKINLLLPAIQLVRADKGFSITSKAGEVIDEDNISSGESELIALAIEVLVFSRSEIPDKVLLLDEPDVHLHPDLQNKFVQFIETIADEMEMRVVIATHSTAIIGAFSENADLAILPVTSKDQREFESFRRARVCDEILPIFGVHPLSTVFNQSPVILVEGEDDKRVLEQAVRSSNGSLKLYPCVVGSVDELAEWESWLDKFLPVIYDEPKGFSLRDLDESQQAEIDDLGVVCRIRLNCYSIENLLLTIECLKKHGFDESMFLTAINDWISNYPEHKYIENMKELAKDFEGRKTLKIKNVRNIIIAILETNKPWEVVLGQLLASNMGNSDFNAHTINDYLGNKAKSELFS